MPTRDDIQVIQQLSPRVAEVAQPSSEVVMQDYVDTLRIEEERFQSMGSQRLIDASGKQDLGGGVLVGITVEENNLQLAFEPNTTPAHVGSVTTPSGAPNAVGRVQFSDSTADFVAANVQPGSFVINFTDNSIVDVVRVVNTTTLECRTPANGADNEFDIADVIHVFNIRQCTTSGGNLVAKDANGSTIPAILPTAFTQVILQTSSSATIQELTEIRYATYQNAAWVQATSSNTGTAYPNATPLQPVNNINDAVAVATALGFKQIRIIGNYTLTTGDVAEGFSFVGQDPDTSLITLEAAALLTDSKFSECSITGTLDGQVQIRTARVVPPLDLVSGSLFECLIEAGTISLGGSEDVNILNCWSGVAGTSTPIIDYNGSGRDLLIREYSGGIELRNKSGADNASIDLSSGQVILDSTVTAGTVVVRGVGSLTDNSVGATVINSLINSENTGKAVWDAQTSDHSVTGSFGDLVARRLLTVAKFFGLR